MNYNLNKNNLFELLANRAHTKSLHACITRNNYHLEYKRKIKRFICQSRFTWRR